MTESAPLPGRTWVRRGINLLLLLLVSAQIGTAVYAYLGARTASADVTRSRAEDLMMLVRRTLRAVGELDTHQAEEIFQDLRTEGIRFLEVRDPQNGVVLSLGQSAFPLPAMDLPLPSKLPFVESHRALDLVRAVGVLPLPHEPGLRWEPRGGRRKAHRLVVEFEPKAATRLIAQASWALWFSLLAALVFILGAFVFRRLEQRAEEIQRQLEKEHKLAALGEMSAVLGHELRNPITALKGHAQLLLEKLGQDHPGWGGAEVVVREAVRLEKLVSQVLEFVRAGKLERALVPPREVAQGAMALLDGARIHLQVEDTLPAWSLDRARMQQVLVNLLDNALQATGQDGRVGLTIRRQGNRLVFEVTDGGPGIDEAARERLFEPFFTTRAKGTGLGLAVARRIVEAHEGFIEGKNRPEGGAVFTVTL